MAKTKAQLEAEIERLRSALISKARELASLRNEAFDLRWQLGLDKPQEPAPDAPFDPPGHVGVPGYVQDLRERLKAELAAKSKGRRHA
ncbi:hypothetical protein H4CHR_02958 [Variovorax sp. PBS-H4]|uniref:hypothetical protein n=1 Tax=Variovorax sp. PBS-H4 TaxID=434008 RepID=UPI00131993D9|nr:hypothetical protein [Variovorax sp. PBS-H4]VTU32175.1 hypothetical protein H4CHR_02958 [Variovorax sp. PBS-H4]